MCGECMLRVSVGWFSYSLFLEEDEGEGEESVCVWGDDVCEGEEKGGGGEEDGGGGEENGGEGDENDVEGEECW